eukprot:GHVT01008274.1.p1 GENE.GHVT01008274.1~~GHVT01008274.1.p1  ORF type:complete len:519 (-),score=120.33 GHVT01008274.1:95-1651(-)
MTRASHRPRAHGAEARGFFFPLCAWRPHSALPPLLSPDGTRRRVEKRIFSFVQSFQGFLNTFSFFFACCLDYFFSVILSSHSFPFSPIILSSSPPFFRFFSKLFFGSSSQAPRRAAAGPPCHWLLGCAAVAGVLLAWTSEPASALPSFSSSAFPSSPVAPSTRASIPSPCPASGPSRPALLPSPSTLQPSSYCWRCPEASTRPFFSRPPQELFPLCSSSLHYSALSPSPFAPSFSLSASASSIPSPSAFFLPTPSFPPPSSSCLRRPLSPPFCGASSPSSFLRVPGGIGRVCFVRPGPRACARASPAVRFSSGTAAALAPPNAARVLPVPLEQEIRTSFLAYALSTILSRALPDARDGLKPVHRRIIYAMKCLGLSPSSPFRKSARVVGEVLGRFHPHGDQSVYDALVRLAQDFHMGSPLVAGHGNFGSIDDDPPAAMRYTECKLSKTTWSILLRDLKPTTVHFCKNFDGNEVEPSVLPARLPQLLLNGSSGIAVGMSTFIPPHNLAELANATMAYLQ